MPNAPDPVYPGGYAELLRRVARGLGERDNTDAVIPPADIDLNALCQATVDPADFPRTGRKGDARDKRARLAADFAGAPMIHFEHAGLIAALRRSGFPDRTPGLFLRLWSEQGGFLSRTLPVRWLVSAAVTFAEHGQTTEQRQAGLGLSLLFDLIKLHEAERGLGATTGPRRPSASPPLPFDLPKYSWQNGDLDARLLTRLWIIGQSDPTIRPLSARLLTLLNNEPGTVFARIQAIKKRGGG